MKAATWPRAEPHEERLLVVDPKSGVLRDARIAEREGYLEHEFGDSCLVLPGSNQ